MNSENPPPGRGKTVLVAVNIALSVVILMAIVFFVGYFIREKESNSDNAATLTTVEQATPTPEPTPTPPPEASQEILTTATNEVFSPYLVKVLVNSLPIFNSTNGSNIVGWIEDKGIYTIVEEYVGTEFTLWGKLKSGAGWIILNNYSVEVYNQNQSQNQSQATYEEEMQPYLIKVLVNSLPIYSNTNGDNVVGWIEDKGIYTIVEEYYGGYSTLWGKLKSGAGWIILNDYSVEMYG